MDSGAILIADDEADVVALAASALRAAGFSTITAPSGDDALAQIRESSPDLAILDLNMPGMPGLDLCRTLRADPRTTSLPIIILTGRTKEVDRIVAFELGVDDYLTKPFSPRELVLRVRNILRNTTRRSHPPVFDAGPIRVETSERMVTVSGEPIELSDTEYKLLLALMKASGNVLSRHSLLQQVWGRESVDERTVDSLVRRLRDRLGETGDLIHTVRTFGYRIAVG